MALAEVGHVGTGDYAAPWCAARGRPVSAIHRWARLPLHPRGPYFGPCWHDASRPADLLSLAITLLAAARLSVLPTILIVVISVGLLRHLLG